MASSNVNLGVLSKNYEFFETEKANLNLRRNYLFLFDNMKNEVMKVDVSIGVSLLDRPDQEKMQSKMEKLHPLIPNAKMGTSDKGPLYMQSFGKGGQAGQKPQP